MRGLWDMRGVMGTRGGYGTWGDYEDMRPAMWTVREVTGWGLS